MYRLRFVGRTEKCTYIGETANLARRMVGYLNPGNSQRTNKRVHAEMEAHLEHGEVIVDVAETATVTREDATRALDLTDMLQRRLAESAAIASTPVRELLNEH